MRVLQAMAGGRHGGAETFFTRLVTALGRAGLEQRAVIRRHPERARALRAAGIEVVELGFGGAFDLVTRPRLRREIAAFKPDVVLTWMNRAARFCPSTGSAGRRFVHAARLGGYYNLKYYRRCDHLIGITRGIVDYVVRGGWPPERAHHLPNFADIADAPAADRAALDTPPDATVLLALGRLHENKALDVAIEALARLPGAYLWIAGDGPLRRELEALAARSGMAPRVRFLGWRENTAGLFAAADVCVYPSRSEPHGTVTLEAWAYRVPLVAAASVGPSELIDDGVNGILVPIDDSGALAAAVARLIADRALAARLVAAGRATYEASYTESAVIRRYLEFFARVTA